MNPHFTEYNWPERYFRGLHDFEARITVRDTITDAAGDVTAVRSTIEVCGRGIDFDEELALEKASSEAIERFICLKLNMMSEGFSVSGRISSDEHAKNEALERYYFFVHEIRRQPFEQIISPEASRLIEQFDTQNPRYSVRFYRMAIKDSINGVVCAIGEGAANPMFLGIALSTDLERALTRSMCEALANYARFSDAPKEYFAEVELDENAWICKAKFLKEVSQLFACDNLGQNRLPPIAQPTLLREPIDISRIDLLRECPILPIQYKIGDSRPGAYP